MIARRVSHAILILCFGGLLTAASDGGCGPVPAPICALECEHGFKTDSDGNTYCECRASEACILVLPAPHEDPDTGECVSFPTVCDIPDGWGLCSASCTYGGVTYADGDSFPASDGCNTCTCTAGGTIACTEMACAGCLYNGVLYSEGHTFPAGDTCSTCTCLADGNVACTPAVCGGCVTSDGDWYAVGDSFAAPDGCNTCTCTADGTIACTEMACVNNCTYDDVQYSPGDQFPAGDGCNTCFCDDNGNIACTLAVCNGCINSCGEWYAVGDTFPAPDGCNTCSCLADGSIACTEMACVDGCTYDGVFYADGTTFPSSDGCNSCTCSGTMVLCTLRACAPVCDGLDQPSCDASAACNWLTPGCGSGDATIDSGCYPSVDCQSDSDCSAGEICEQVTVDPCANSACNACGMVRGVCLPEPTDCFGAWLDQFGNCRGPADGMLPADCCYPTDPNQGLCTQSGGTWDPNSCGHYTCGGYPACDAIIPGCDCGPDKNFVDGVGCIYDASCGGACFANSDCPAGTTCNTCPMDPTCPMCAVCGPPVCQAIVCDFDVDCPAGSTCVGSSICPPDALCIWAGEPGVCLPATTP